MASFRSHSSILVFNVNRSVHHISQLLPSFILHNSIIFNPFLLREPTPASLGFSNITLSHPLLLLTRECTEYRKDRSPTSFRLPFRSSPLFNIASSFLYPPSRTHLCLSPINTLSRPLWPFNKRLLKIQRKRGGQIIIASSFPFTLSSSSILPIRPICSCFRPRRITIPSCSARLFNADLYNLRAMLKLSLCQYIKLKWDGLSRISRHANRQFVIAASLDSARVDR